MTKYTITGRFDDGEEIQFDCASDEDVISAGLRNGIILMAQCRKGACASCKALCEEGDYEFGEHMNVQVLPPEEEEEGYVVCCQTYPEEDLVIKFPYESVRLGEVVEGQDIDPVRLAEVIAVEQVSSTVYRYVLRPLDIDTELPVAVDYLAGQYAEIEIPGTELSRAFSMASISKSNDGVLEFMIRLVPGGKFSEYLKNNAEVGQRVNFKGPHGVFGLKKTDRTRCFVGGSTGLAPLVSILREMKRTKDRTDAHLFFGMGDQDAMFYEKELIDLAESMPNLTLHLSLMEPPADWAHEVGSSVDIFKKIVSEFKDSPDVYVCGPGPMIDATLVACDELSIAHDQIHHEKFLASGNED